MTDFENLLSSMENPAISITMTVEDLKDLIKHTIDETIKALETIKEPQVVWLTPEQVSKRLNINRSTLWKWDKEGYIPSTKFGNRVRYKLSDVERIELAEK